MKKGGDDGSGASVQINGASASSFPLSIQSLSAGTLASTPRGMFPGVVWSDTTDSTDHPILRISTVAT